MKLKSNFSEQIGHEIMLIGLEICNFDPKNLTFDQFQVKFGLQAGCSVLRDASLGIVSKGIDSLCL